MHAPESFVEKLESTFRSRLRVRWSVQRGAFIIEQKVRRGLFPGHKPTRKGWDETNDKYVQARDGVVEIMEVRTGTLMDCPKCGHQLKVPFMHSTAIRCDYCRLQGKEPAVNAVFMPLGDALIDYLKSIDPENPISESLADDVDRANCSLEASMENDAMNSTEASLRDRYKRMVGIPQVGYTGKEFRG